MASRLAHATFRVKTLQFVFSFWKVLHFLGSFVKAGRFTQKWRQCWKWCRLHVGPLKLVFVCVCVCHETTHIYLQKKKHQQRVISSNYTAMKSKRFRKVPPWKQLSKGYVFSGSDHCSCVNQDKMQQKFCFSTWELELTWSWLWPWGWGTRVQTPERKWENHS